MCNLTELSTKWKDILATLVSNYHFEDFLIPRSAEAFRDWYDNYGENCSSELGLCFHHGMTRLVINNEDCDCVVKIQFLADEYYKYQYDYNKVEAAVYAKAIEKGLQTHFAWMYKLFNFSFCYKNIDYFCPIYAMEFCEVDDYENETLASDRQFHWYCEDNGLNEEDCEDERSNFESDGEEDDMLELACDLWGDKEDFEKFESFLGEMDISDLHSGNWGFVDGRFVVCDYGGYNGTVAGIDPTINFNYVLFKKNYFNVMV